MNPSAAFPVLPQKPHETTATMSLEERFDAIEKRLQAHEKRTQEFQKGVEHYCQVADEYIKDCDELKEQFDEFVADNEKERAAWDRTARLVGFTLVAALAYQASGNQRGNGPVSGPRRTHGRE